MPTELEMLGRTDAGSPGKRVRPCPARIGYVLAGSARTCEINEYTHQPISDSGSLRKPASVTLALAVPERRDPLCVGRRLLASPMETRAFRIKLKPGSLARVREWAHEIMRRKQEALETLRDESVLLEHFFLEQAADGDYLIGVMTAENFERAQASVRESTHDIDAYHRQFKRDAWQSGEPLELLVDLNRFQE